MADLAYRYDEPNPVRHDDGDAVTLEDLEARLDALQTDHEFMAERLRHIEHALMLCFMLLLLITVIELQLISVTELKDSGKQLWDWIEAWRGAR